MPKHKHLRFKLYSLQESPVNCMVLQQSSWYAVEIGSMWGFKRAQDVSWTDAYQWLLLGRKNYQLKPFFAFSLVVPDAQI